ncbi:hypothetical protein B0H13DRAFT_2302474 [Mycena leptocephala]|nr:hypothetical protein B0H13DRAFT_2302474 [Mycena leptocephala]
MESSATFCKMPLSTSVNLLSQCSLVSLDWILTSGIPAPQSVVSGMLTLLSGNGMCSMNVKLSVTASLPYGLVLGHYWLFFCCETLLHASFCLSSGIFYPAQGLTVSPSIQPQTPDYRDTDGKLIAPAELYHKLVEGPLIIVMVSLATYIIKDQTMDRGNPIPDKKAFDMRGASKFGNIAMSVLFPIAVAGCCFASTIGHFPTNAVVARDDVRALRKDFFPPLGKSLAAADILIAANSVTDLFVNGDFVGTSNANRYARRLCASLMPSENVIAVNATTWSTTECSKCPGTGRRFERY